MRKISGLATQVLAAVMVSQILLVLASESPNITTALVIEAPAQSSAISKSNSTTIAPVRATSPEDSLMVIVKDIEEIKKTINQHIDSNRSENRLIVNKPTIAPQMSDFAPESMEARVSDATAQFGLNFINNLATDYRENVVISPLSLQNLIGMMLLGSSDNSTSQKELAKVLGYDSIDFSLSNSTLANRLKPHEAMHSVFQNILAATHLAVTQPHSPIESSGLLNTNSGSLATPTSDNQQGPQTGLVAAHLQTSVRDDDDLLSGQVNFTLANLVLTNKDAIELKPDYENDLKSYYSVKLEQFSRNSAENKNRPPLHELVNNWVKNMTHNQIEKLVEEPDLSGDLAMVLLNAAHFKGRWLHTFNTKATTYLTFFNYGSEKEATKVKFMRQKGMFNYADFTIASLQGELSLQDGRIKSSEDAETLLTEDAAPAGKSSIDTTTTQAPSPTIELSKEEVRRMELINKLNCSVLMLPFSLNDGQELSMVLLLPAKRDGIANLQAALNGQVLNEIYRSLNEAQVQVELPRFSFDASYDAKLILEKMGLVSIFNESADLSNMFNAKSGQNLGAKVDKAIHKAKINVDESGAEAAAASMFTIALRNFIRPPTPIFTANHPFLFIIRHNRSNMPLFMGRVSSF